MATDAVRVTRSVMAGAGGLRPVERVLAGRFFGGRERLAPLDVLVAATVATTVSLATLATTGTALSAR
jgi:hypothetical protein